MVVCVGRIQARRGRRKRDWFEVGRKEGRKEGWKEGWEVH